MEVCRVLGPGLLESALDNDLGVLSARCGFPVKSNPPMHGRGEVGRFYH